MGSFEIFSINKDGDKGFQPAVRRTLSQATIMRCIFHLLENILQKKFDPTRRQLEKTAYKPTLISCIMAFEKLILFLDAMKLVKRLDVRSWTLRAALHEVFGRLSNQAAKTFNLLMKNIAVRSCSRAKMIQMILSWSYKCLSLKNIWHRLPWYLVSY